MSEIARYYDESKNPDRGMFPGVPLADLTEEQYTSYPEWLRRSIDAAPFYRKTKPAQAAKAEKPDHATSGNG